MIAFQFVDINEVSLIDDSESENLNVANIVEIGISDPSEFDGAQ